MAQSDTTSLRELLGGVSEISDPRLQKVLKSAARKVKADGVAEEHEAFAELQEYYAASILEYTGDLTSLASKSIADVSETYATDQVGGFESLYRKELINITGRKGFIV